MVSGSISLLYFPLAFMGGGRAASPIVLKYGEIFCMSSLKSEDGWLAKPQAWLAGPQSWLDGPEGGRTDERKIFPLYRTLSPIGAAAQKPDGRPSVL